MIFGCPIDEVGNNITVFEQLNSAEQKEIHGIKTPVLDKLKK
jgi:hypothetical protein